MEKTLPHEDEIIRYSQNGQITLKKKQQNTKIRDLLKNKNDILSLCQYGKSKIPAIIGNNNIYGTQFHPEKSGKNGLKIIHNFLSLKQ